MENDLIRNLYLHGILDETKKPKQMKRLKPKELAPKEKEGEKEQNLPFLPGLHKGGNVIIQSWNTRVEIPPEIPLPHLPIIVDPKKIMNKMALKNMLSEASEKFEMKKKEEQFGKMRMMELGEKLLGAAINQLHKRSSAGSLNSFKGDDSHHSLVPLNMSVNSLDGVVKRKEEESALVPYTNNLSNRASFNKPPKDQKKKDFIDFSSYNRHLYLKDNEFLYLKRVGNPIEFTECVYSDLIPSKRDKKKKSKSGGKVEYITMSKNTVMHYQNGASYIHSVPEWIDFYTKFRKLLGIRLFKNYRTAKLFDLWRKFYKKSVKTLQTEKLKKKFHHIDEALLMGIMEIRATLKEMAQVNIFRLDIREPVTLTKFQEDHKVLLKELDRMIETFRKSVKKSIEKACSTSYQVYKELKKITLEDNMISNSNREENKEIPKPTTNKPNNKKDDYNSDANFVQNFLKDSMPYAQDATRRTHYKKLLRYIRVVDFLFNEAKYTMVKNSLQQLADKFSRLYDCCVNNWVDNPLIVLYDLPLQDQIHYIPHMEQIHKAVFEEFIQEKIYAVIYRKSFIDPQEFPSYMVCFEEVFETSVDQNSNLNIRIKEDYFIGHLFYKIKVNFENCHKELEKFTKEQLSVLINYNTYSSISFKTLEELATPEELKSLLDKFIIESKTIAVIKRKKNLGIFQFNLGNLIEKVQKAPSKWINDMRDLIPQVLRNKLKHLISILNGNLKRLNLPVVDVETFISLKTSVKDIVDVKDNIDQKNSDINDILQIIRDDKEIKIPDFDTKYIKEKESLFVEFEKKLSDMGYFLENNMAKYKKELRDNISRFDKEIKNMMEELNVEILNVYNEENYSAIFYIENKSVAIKKLIDKKEFFRKQEELIEVDDTSNFENLDNLVYDYELKYKLWESVREFQELSKKWDKGQVLVIEIPAMESLLSNWIDTGKVSEVDLENPNVPRVLLQKTRNYELILPVVKAFQNPNVNTEESFRESIKQILNTDIDIKEHEFSLDKLMQISEVYEKIPDILELNNRANEEKRLNNIYNEIKDNFSAHKIPLKLERSNKQQNEKGSDKWVIYPRDYDNEYEWLEDKLMTLKKSLLTPYADIVREKVNKLVKDCMKYLQFLDEFNVYQRFSNVIDSIFTPENLREVPSEYKRYLNESIAKTLTKLLKENSNLNRYVEVSQKVMNNLQTINKNYEDFFSYVEEYLENKRKESLKYFLVSNEELLEILAYPDSSEVKNKYISKMIHGITNIDLGGETDDMMKVTTIEEETLTIKLTKGKTFKDVLESIEIDISKKLKSSFKSFRKDYENSLKSKSAKKPKDVLMDIIKNRDNLAQAIFTFMYSFFIDSLEKALSTDDVFDKIIDIKIESKERRKNFIKQVKDSSMTNLDRRVLLNQIALENYFTEITKNLIREDCNSVTDFNWLKILQIKLDSEQIFIKVFNSANFEYGYEYVGLHNNFIVLPQTEKLYLTITNCFTMRKPCFMYGLNESGKKETMKTLAKIFGKNMTVFKCSEQFDINSFNKQLYGIIKNGSWLCLDNLNLMAVEMISVVAQEIMSIYRGLNDKESFVVFKNEKFLVDKNIQIFSMNNLTEKNVSVSVHIKNYFRLIGSCVPDLNMFITASFKNLGFSKVNEYARKCTFLIEYLNSKTSSLNFKRIGLHLFNSILKRIEREVTNISPETFDKFLRISFENSFGNFLTNEENCDLQRVMNNIFSYKEPSLLQRGSLSDTKVEESIRQVVQHFNFKGEKGLDYIGKLKDIYYFLQKRDMHLLVGPSTSGKSQAIEILSKVAERLNKKDPFEDKLFKIVKVFPKAYDSLFLFSENQRRSKIQFYNVFFFNQIKLLFNSEVPKTSDNTSSQDLRSSSPERRKRDENEFENMKSSQTEFKENSHLKILYFDGQIDPTWIDHLNLLNSETKSQCMANGDTLNISDIKILFETGNLTYATPSFITNNFLVNFDTVSFNWENILYNWINQNNKIIVNNDLKNYIRGLFENYFPKLYEFILNNKFLSMNFSENYVIRNFITLFDSILPEFDFEEKRIGKKNTNMVPKIETIKKSTLSIFIFSCAWTTNFFTNFILKTKIEKFISDIFKADDLKGPIFDYFIDEEKNEFELWSYKLENNDDYILDLGTKLEETQNFTYNKIFIPNVENIPYQWIVNKYLALGVPVFYSGKSGQGKSLLINSLLNNLNEENTEWCVHRYLVNHNTTTKKIENFLMQNLEYIKRDLIGDLYDRKVILFVDDCNMQKKDKYYSQSTLEALRQIINTNLVYDGKSNMQKKFQKLNLLCCGNISSYLKNFNTDRFIHSFYFVNQNNFSDDILTSVFKTSLENQIRHFIPQTSSITSTQFVNATLNLFEVLKGSFKLSPKKLHYSFSLRDVTKIFQSVHNFTFTSQLLSEYNGFLEKLWFYETSRVFLDRMNKESDRTKFREDALKSFNSIYKKSYKQNNFFGLDYLYSFDLTKPALVVNTPNEENEINTDKKPTVKDDYLFYENNEALFAVISKSLEDYYLQHKHQHVLLNQITFDLVVRLVRILHFNKGHMILIGSTLTGKMSIAQFVCHILGKNFLHLDENSLPKIDSLIRSVLIEASYKNTPTVLFINNSLLEKDEALEILNMLVNTKEIVHLYDINKNAEKDFGYKMEENEIIKKIELNLNLIMGVLPYSDAYKKLYHDYPYISKHCSSIYIERWDKEEYLNVVIDKVHNISALDTKFVDFAAFLYDFHEFTKNLASHYENKVMCKIEISSKNFIEMVTFFENNVNVYREKLMVQKKKYESAVDVIPKAKAMIDKLNEELEKLEPEKAEHDKAIEDKKAEFSKKQVQKTQITNLKIEEDKPLLFATNQRDLVKEQIDKNLEEFVDKVTRTSRELNKLTRNELLDFKNYIENHTLSKFLLAQIYSYQGESNEWDFIKKNLDPKYIQSVTNVDYFNAPQKLVNFVKETISHPDFVTSDQLQKSFKTCGLFSDWFQAMHDYFKEFHNQKTLMEEGEELNKRIYEHEKVIKSHTDNLMEISKQIADIEKELSARDKKKQATMFQIDKREVLKKIGEELIETAIEKNETWEHKRDLIESTLTNIEFYTIFISIYLNYAPPFNYSYRTKIKDYLYNKAEEMAIPEMHNLDFNKLVMEFIDLKANEKDLFIFLSEFDDHTKENFLMMHLNKKVPFIIDNNRISKWFLSDYFTKKDQKKMIFTKPFESDFHDKVDSAMKEGLYLVIEQSDEKLYTTFKNVIKEEKFTDKGKTYVMIENVAKECSDKFRMLFIKDKIDMKFNSKFWIESLVLNFVPSKDQIKSNLLKELSINEDPLTYSSFSKINTDKLKEQTRLLEMEDKIISLFNQFDYSSNIEKNNANQNCLGLLKYECSQHTVLLSTIETLKERLFKLENEISKFKDLAEDAASLYKWMARFFFLDSIYNFSFFVFGMYIKEYYKEKILTRNEKYPEYLKEDLLDLILYVYNRVAFMFSYDHRKILLLLLVLSYLAKKDEIAKDYKETLHHLQNIFFEGNLDTDTYNEESPIKSITHFQWNCLKEINDKSSFMLSSVIESMHNEKENWEEYLSKGINFSEQGFKLNVSAEVEQNSNILTKIALFVILFPFKIDQIMRNLFETVIGKGYSVPRMSLTQTLMQTPNRKAILLIDNDYLSEREIVIYYSKRYSHEGSSFYRLINLDSEMNQASFEAFNIAIKNGHLVIIRNIHNAKQSLVKLFEILNDPKITINDSFRLIFLTKSNTILSSSVYENCVLLNRNFPEYSTIKEVIEDTMEDVAQSHVDFLLNRKYNTLQSRKIVYHLLITHSILKNYQSYFIGIYNNPVEFSKKDFLNCFYFVSNYLNALGEEKENINNNPNSYANNNYIALMNLIFDTFYCNRLVYREETARVMKILQRYFTEDKFLQEGHYFLFKNNTEGKAQTISVPEGSPNQVLTNEDLIKSVDLIPLDSYYEMMVNVPPHVINDDLTHMAKEVFKTISIVTSMPEMNPIAEITEESHFDMDRFSIILINFKNELPDLISVANESSTQIFKVNKHNEYMNPIDESLKFEVKAYNDFLTKVYHHIENMNKILKGDIILDDEYYAMMKDLVNKTVPLKWRDPCFNFKRLAQKKIEKNSLDIWRESLVERFVILRKWLLQASLEIYHVPFFYNVRLFLFSLTNYFSRKANASPETVQLKFIITNLYPCENFSEVNADKIRDLSVLNKNRELVFCSGFVIENAFLDTEFMRIVNDKKGLSEHVFELCPLIAITFTILGEDEKMITLDEEEDEDDEDDEESTKIINVPIFDRENERIFENVEALGHIEMTFDHHYTEDFWVTKAVKISLDF